MGGVVICFAALATRTVEAQGVFLTSTGPINQSFGGAGTAAPLDSMGALNWNPAAISGLRSSEVGFGLGLLLPSTTVSSTVGPSTLAPGFPATTLSGRNASDPGVTPIPTIGYVQRLKNSPWSFGIGVFGVGGFGANYPSSTTNPILTPQAPNGIGVGRVFTQAEFFQIVPTVSYAVTDKFSIGIAPTITLAQVFCDPLILAPPNNANGDAYYTYGPGTATRISWGGGFQVGAYYITDSRVHLGVSVKSTQWMEPLRYNSTDELGRPLVQTVNISLPTIVSLGAAYSGFDRLLFATDVRYWDYGNAAGFSGTGFNADGSVRGLGWRSVWSVSNGIQFDATPRLTLRGGYTYGQNPVPNSQAMFNVGSPLIIENWLSCGASFRFVQNVVATLAYTHGFQNQITGPFVVAAGSVPGTSVTSAVSSDLLTGGLTVQF